MKRARRLCAEAGRSEIGNQKVTARKQGSVPIAKISYVGTSRSSKFEGCKTVTATLVEINSAGGVLSVPVPTETEAQKARVEKIKKMGPEHIAPVAVFLATEAAKDISGQVFGVRGKEIMLFSHMRPIRNIHHDQGWTPERLADMFPGTLRHHLVPLETSGQYFNYDPMV